MNKQELVELTNKVYKLTLFFPKKEPLRYKTREIADRILENFIFGKNAKKDLEVLKSYFDIAKFQNWVSYFDISSISKEYDEIELSQVARGPSSGTGRGRALSEALGSRKEKIIGILKEKGQIQVGEVNKILPQVTKRTLRRDFDKLLQQGLVERIGQNNSIYYKLKELG